MSITSACGSLVNWVSVGLVLKVAVASISVLCLSCGCALVSPGKTYYIATNGSNTNPGTKTKPFKTVQQTTGVLKPGDTVIMRAGRYPAFTVHNLRGTADAPITFTSYKGEKAVIDRGLGGKDVAWTIHILGHCCYLTFENLEVTDSDPLIDTLRKLDPNKPDDLAEFLKHLDEIQYRDGVRINPPGSGEDHHDLIFRNLEVHHLIGLGFSGKCDNAQFLDNHVYDLGRPRSGYGWYTRGTNQIYRGNRVHDCSYGFHLYEGPIKHAIVENNIIYNCGAPYYHMSSKQVHQGGCGLLLWAEGTGNVIRNNVLWGNKIGISVSGQDVLVVNNTVYDSGKTGFFTFEKTGMIVRNNIVYRSAVKDVEETAGNTFDHNLVGVDPLFVNPDAHDFHLKPRSPAIDAGLAIPGFDTDIEGTKRPKGKAWDAGAYESKR